MRKLTLFLFAALTASAGTVGRNLPVEYVNDGDPAYRSNGAIAYTQDAVNFYGDDFMLGRSPQEAWRIDSVTVWLVQEFDPTQQFDKIALYGSMAGQPLSEISSTVQFEKALYPGGEAYDPDLFALYKATFTTNWVISGAGGLVNFGVYGEPSAENVEALYLHMTRYMADSGGANGTLKLFNVNDLNQAKVISPGQYPDWNGGADINVLVDVNAVPEPGTFALLGAALLVLPLLRRK